MRAKNCDRHALLDINLLCKFVEFMFINVGGTKPLVKHDGWMGRQMHGRTEDIL